MTRRVPWEHIQFTETCWLWVGPQHKGYGKFGGTTAHRHVFLALGRVIPDGHDLHHECGKPLCVNPDHLTPLTRGEHAAAHAARITSCVNGHAYTPANTYIRPNGQRDCRTCIRLRVAKYKQRIGVAA